MQPTFTRAPIEGIETMMEDAEPATVDPGAPPVGPVTFGTMTFGAQVDEPTARLMVERCLDAGVKMFDTANTYTGGRSEEILGRIVAPVRDEVFLASKVGGQEGERPLSAESIRLEVDGSLRRLGTDYLDLYYLHRPDPSTPLEESLTALQGLVAAGKVRYIGQSNFAAWQIAELLQLAGDGPAPMVSQPMYNLLARRIEEEYVAFSAHHRLTNVVYNPIAGGFLTGKYRAGDPPPPGTRLRNKNYQRRYWNDDQALQDMLSSLADFYDKEVDTSVSRFVTLIEPALLVMMGLVIAVLVLALYMPLFELSNVVNQ